MPMPLRYAYVRDFTYSPGTSISLPPYSQTEQTFTLTLDNVPAGLTGLRLNRDTVLSRQRVTGTSVSVAAPAPGGLTQQFPYTPGPGMRHELRLRYQRADSSSDQDVYVRTESTAAAHTLDASQLPLPWLTPDSLTATVDGFQYTTLENAGTGDALLGIWSADWTGPGGQTTSVGWTIAAPANPTALVLPTLPAELAAIDPRQAPTPDVNGIVAAIDIDVLDGFASYRAHADQFLQGPQAMPEILGTQAFTLRIAQDAALGRLSRPSIFDVARSLTQRRSGAHAHE